MRQQAALMEAARAQAAREEAARQHAIREQAAYEQAMRERAAAQAAQLAAQRTAEERARREHAAREHAMREQAAYGHAMRERAAAQSTRPAQRDASPAQSAEREDPPPSRRRTGRIAVLAGLVIALLVAGGVVGIRLVGGDQATQPKLAPVPSFGVPGAVLPNVPANRPAPSASGVAAAVAEPLTDSRLGTHVSVQITDMATGTMLFGQNQDSPTTPASTMKLATSLALLSLRGPAYRITTKVVAGAEPGEVVLIGAGDPTLGAGATPTYPESARLRDLAGAVKSALGDIEPSKVIIDDSLFTGPTVGPGWDQNDIHSTYATRIVPVMTDGGRINTARIGNTRRYDDPDMAAGQSFAKYLDVPTSAVVRGKAPAPLESGSDPGAPGAVLGSVRSAPLVRIIETLLAESDNVAAECMARQVAIAMGKPVSFAGAAEAVTEQLTKLGMPMQDVRIMDGSGLSPQDRLTPALLTAILRYAADTSHPNVQALYTGLPVAGWSGTLSDRFDLAGTTAGQGLIRAKTGTLDGVSALAGTLVDASGRVLIVVIMSDKAASGSGVMAAIDRVSAAVQACGCG
jgi:serine-type D-Ala-D-Ala carboxypeptidase/endopeptidase (penicillin-binding protein 4)